MTNSELLTAISEMFDAKLEARLKPIEDRLDAIENRLDSLENRMTALENRIDALENNIDSLENQLMPRLQTIESCYLDTYKRYCTGADKIQAVIDDVDILKTVVRRHSELLQMTS